MKSYCGECYAMESTPHREGCPHFGGVVGMVGTYDLQPFGKPGVRTLVVDEPTTPPMFMHALCGVSHVTVYEGATIEDVKRVQNALQSLVAVLEKRLRDAGNT